MLYYKDECFWQHTDVSFSTYRYTHRTSEHKHIFFEIAYVVDGEGYHIIDGRSYPIRKGNYMMLDTTAAHCYDGNVEIANIIFNPQFLDRNFREMTTVRELYNAYVYNKGFSIIEPEPLYHIFNDTGEVKHKIDLIRAEIEQKHLCFAEYIQSELINIILISLRSICREDLSGSGNGPVQIIEEYIHAHYNEDINLSHLCDEMGYTLPYISKRFKEVTGNTFSVYLQRTRINFARKLFVNNTDMSIEEVARRVGYNDIKHFTSVFKKFAGCTPGYYSRYYSRIASEQRFKP